LAVEDAGDVAVRRWRLDDTPERSDLVVGERGLEELSSI
jgi:hypothetical protein